MKILILGGDGYLGWPTAMHLSAHGHEVAVADNNLRRRMCLEQDIEPLFPVPTLQRRAHLWREKSGQEVRVFVGDLAEWDFIARVFREFTPDAVVHYAEQPSAPYSMMNRETATLTLHNNLGVTANTIFAVREFAPEAHIVKLGTMGEYGTPNIDIEEGWIDIEHKGRKDRFLFPRQAGSLYHTTKIQDTDLLWFYVRVWGLRVTDLMQGPVYGLWTDENAGEEALFPFFNYDEIFGTVVNRFMVQAVAGVWSGGADARLSQHQGHLELHPLSVEHPSNAELRVFNQFTETFSVNELAERVQRCGQRNGLEVRIEAIANPRKELEEHYYNPVHTGLLELGLEPHLMTDEVLDQMLAIVLRYRDRIRPDTIFRGVKWN